MKKKWLRRGLIIFFSLVFVVCAVWMAVILVDYARADALYEDVRQQVFTMPESRPTEDEGEAQPGQSVPPEEEEEELVLPTVDFATLQSINSDIIGWIWIPDTVVSYPVLVGETNQTYLYTTYDGSHSSSGSIFLDYRIQGQLSAPNAILYGHHMKNGSMFSLLMKYRQQDYADAHPDVYLFTPEATLVYRVFSAYTTQADSDAYTYDFADSAAFQDYLEKLCSRTVITAPDGYQANSSDPILTLSTCTTVTTLQRMVVHAQLVERIPLEGGE